jgi:hypothetical protein
MTDGIGELISGRGGGRCEVDVDDKRPEFVVSAERSFRLFAEAAPGAHSMIVVPVVPAIPKAVPTVRLRHRP